MKKKLEPRCENRKDSTPRQADPAVSDGKLEKEKSARGVSESSDPIQKDENHVPHNRPDHPETFPTEEVSEIIPPKSEMRHGKYKKRTSKKKSFNPWRELDRASKKNVSRRDLVTGLFRFLPRQDDK